MAIAPEPCAAAAPTVLLSARASSCASPLANCLHVAPALQAQDAWQQQLALPPNQLRTLGDVFIRVRRFVFVPHQAPHARVWLNLRASQLGYGEARRASVHLTRHLLEGTVRLGVESLNQLVEPFASERYVDRRTVRRAGPVASYDYHTHKRGSWRRLRRGTCVHASARLWPHRPSRGHGLDARSEISGLYQRPGGARLWGRARMRALWGAEQDHLELGGWQPELGSPAPRGGRPLAEALLGYEDVQRHGNKLAQLQGGLGWALGEHALLELFIAASRIGVQQQSFDDDMHDGALLRAVGLAIAKRWHMGQTPITLAYQVSHRFDRPAAPQLHLVSLLL